MSDDTEQQRDFEAAEGNSVQQEIAAMFEQDFDADGNEPDDNQNASEPDANSTATEIAAGSEDGDQEGSKAAPSGEGQPTATGEGGGTASQPPTATTAGDGQTPDSPQEVAILKQQLEAMRAQVAQLTQTQSQPQAGQTAQAEQQSQDQTDPLNFVPQYGLDIPDDLFNALGSEDPATRKQGINGLINALAQTTHQRVMKQVGLAMQTHVPRIANQTVSQKTEQQRVMEDFYGTHPDLNKPALMPVIHNTARQVMRDLGLNQWSPELRDAIANRVRQELGLQPPQAAPVPAQTQPQAPHMFNGGSRPPAVTPSQEGDLGRQFEEMRNIY